MDPKQLERNEELALWINAYKAYTIELINRHEDRASIRNLNLTLGFLRGGGPWSESLARVGEIEYTLDEIEHEIIRPRFADARPIFDWWGGDFGDDRAAIRGKIAGFLSPRLERDLLQSGRYQIPGTEHEGWLTAQPRGRA